jgi:hypothetical protein
VPVHPWSNAVGEFYNWIWGDFWPFQARLGEGKWQLERCRWYGSQPYT